MVIAPRRPAARRPSVHLAGAGGKLGDELRQSGIPDLARRGPRLRIAELEVGLGSQRTNRQPRSEQESRDEPEETYVCRHGPTLSHLLPGANFWVELGSSSLEFGNR